MYMNGRRHEEFLNRQTSEWTTVYEWMKTGQIKKLMTDWLNESIKWMSKWIYEWMNECMNAWMNEWMNEWTNLVMK